MVPQIFITASITMILAAFCIGGFLAWRAPREEHPFLLLLVLLELPMCALAFYCVRMPLLDNGVQHLLDVKSGLYHFVTILYAPLTEEPAKIWLLIFPFVRRRITRENFWRVALALGLGFGIGEMWFVAYSFTSSPAIAHLAWYQLGGFLNERFMVCIMHGCFVTLTLYFFSRGKFLLGFSLAMLAHFIGNLPIYLMQVNFLGIGPTAWVWIITFFLPAYMLAGIAMVAFMATGKGHITHFMFGNSVCPECGTEYPSPLVGFNFFNKRFERCPHCKKWHMVSRFTIPYDSGTKATSPVPSPKTPT